VESAARMARQDDIFMIASSMQSYRLFSATVIDKID
jgi:hypothetical protein